MQKRTKPPARRMAAGLAVSLLAVTTLSLPAQNQPGPGAWLDAKLSPQKRADLVLQQMTLDEKLSVLHGEGMAGWPHMSPAILAVRGLDNGGAGFIMGVPRLGVPRIQMVGRGVRCAFERGQRQVLDSASFEFSFGRELGCGSRMRLRHFDRQGAARTGLQHDARAGARTSRASHATAARSSTWAKTLFSRE